MHHALTVARRGRSCAALAAVLACALFAPAARAQTRVDNPFVGATWYLSPDYARKIASSAAQVSDPTLKARVAKVASYPTAFWLDRIAAINGNATTMGLRAHLDAALQQQQAGKPVVVIAVIYDLPGRDCSALASNGELGPTEIGRYRTEYIDPIAAIEGDPKYASLRIVNIIELDSLPNTITNLTSKPGGTALCDTMKANGNYVTGIQYALSKLHAAGNNTYNYIDAGHHGWLGWDDNMNASAQLFADTARGATGGFATVQGFITNTANYSALVEPYLTMSETLRQSKWVDWNRYVDEKSYASAFRNKLVALGFNSSIGMLIDTSRNGWGGAARPKGASSATSVDTMVNESRIDRRIHAGNWCNQSGAGLGERPQAVGADGIHAYVWVKPPGESDGSSTEIPNDEGKHLDRMCDPTYTGNARNGNNLTGALGGAPLSGQWFHNQIVELVQNAYPPVPAEGGDPTLAGDFQISVSPGSVTVNQGASANTTVLLSKLNGLAGSISLSASGLPDGVSAVFLPASADAQSTLQLSATSSAVTGTRLVTITGTAGSVSHTASLNVTVNSASSPTFTLAASPSSLTLTTGASGTSTITIQPSNGFSSTVALSAEGLPAGVAVAFGNQYPTSSTTVTLTAGSTAESGSRTVTIVGTGGNVTKSTTISLVVNAGGTSSGGTSSGGTSSGGTSSGGTSSGATSSGGTSSGATSSGGANAADGSSADVGGGVGCGCSGAGRLDGTVLLGLAAALLLRVRRRTA